jgi:hypothetical protein
MAKNKRRPYINAMGITDQNFGSQNTQEIPETIYNKYVVRNRIKSAFSQVIPDSATRLLKRGHSINTTNKKAKVPDTPPIAAQ